MAAKCGYRKAAREAASKGLRRLAKPRNGFGGRTEFTEVAEGMAAPPAVK